MAELLDWRSAEARDAIVARAVEVLRTGGLVAFPTETVYGIAAAPAVPGAIERLVHCKGRPEDKPLTLVVGGSEEALRWVPGAGKIGQRLARRGWPGPLTLVFDQGVDTALMDRLPGEAKRRIAPQGSLGLRVPDHDAILDVLDVLSGPLVLTSANRSGEPDAISGEQVRASLGASLDLIIDDGPTRHGRPSSVIRTRPDGWDLLREGVLTAGMIQRLAACVVLFVCTGNTCRSPLAEGLCRKLLAERLGCAPNELLEHGFDVLSAGVSAMMGMGPTAEALETARRRGIELEGHVSRMLSPALLNHADYVFSMTESHLHAITWLYGDAGPKVEMLSPTGEDIPDPIGGDQAVYDACADRIVACLQERVATLDQ